MRRRARRGGGTRSGQRGSLMVALMAGIAIAMILSSVAAQKWSDVVRRDNEAEMMFRAQDLVRALQRYQQDQGHLPMEWKDLMEPGQKGQYFARKLWKDPLVRNGKWQTLYASPQGALIDPTAPGVDPMHPSTGAEGPGAGSDAGVGAGSGGGSGAGAGAGTSATGLPSLFGSQNSSATNRPVGVTGVTPKDDGTVEISGLPIAGVKSRCTEATFRVYKDKTDYAEWLFSIFDLQQPQGSGAPTGPAPTGGGTTPSPPSH